jgi:hypothetical protein
MITLVGFVFGLAVTILLLAPFLLLSGWIVMLCLGALAHIFGVAALAIGFWQSTLVSVILAILFG